MKVLFKTMLFATLLFSVTACSSDDDDEKDDPYNGHEYVDLGLPSGLKWATCNIGATSPEDYGDYYAWGETSTKETYDWETYQWCNGTETSMTKYCMKSKYGEVDNKANLDLADDVAHVKWGGKWRMPTPNQFCELKDECTWTWTTMNGKNGYKVVSKKNSNYIFLPAAGIYNSSLGGGTGSGGYYWSSVLFSTSYAYYLNFYSSDIYPTNEGSRYIGQSVRAVCQ